MSGPKKIGDLVGRVLASRGCNQLTVQMELERQWKIVAGEKTAKHSRVGALRRGVLEILVDNSALLMELEGFQKEELLGRLQAVVEHSAIRGLKFRRA